MEGNSLNWLSIVSIAWISYPDSIVNSDSCLHYLLPHCDCVIIIPVRKFDGMSFDLCLVVRH